MSKLELDQLLTAAVERRDLPFAVAIVANRNTVLYRGAVNATVDAIFRIASMTKPVTSVSIMMLQERGLLNIDDPLEEYLPEYAGREVLDTFDATHGTYTTRPAACPVTLRHLLAHTAGFGYTFSNAIVNQLCQGDRTRQTKLPLLYDPGTQWSYGCATSILGDVITQVTGEHFSTFQVREILQPLGMVDTDYFLKTEDADRLVIRHRRVNGELVAEPLPFEPSLTADGGLLGTAEDYIRFLQMLLNGGSLGNVQLLTPTSVQAMTSNQISALTVTRQPSIKPEMAKAFPLGADEDQFGLGFQLKVSKENDRRTAGSYSWAGIHNTHFWVDPEMDVAAVLLTQLLPFYDEGCIRLLTAFEQAIYSS